MNLKRFAKLVIPEFLQMQKYPESSGIKGLLKNALFVVLS